MKRGSFKKWSNELVSDVDGNVSSKRIVMFTVLIAILISWAFDLFYKMETKDYIFEGLMIIVLTSLGTAAAEKFSLSRNRSRHKESGPRYDDSHLDNHEDEVIN